MKVLLLAPQPFYTERGTPIAVDLVLRALSERGESVDVLTYHLGQDVSYPAVRIMRTPKIGFVRQVSPGFSLPKVLLDLLMFLQVFPMIIRRRYELVHAVEESVFIALILKAVFGIPYIYDMDSSLSQQMLEKYPRLFRPFEKLISALEGLAIRHAHAVVPVCDALSRGIARYNPAKVAVLHDVSLLDAAPRPDAEDLRRELGIGGPMMMYVGNLESYQGIDLLLESFALALRRRGQAQLVIIGGKDTDIEAYQAKARSLGLNGRVHFLGPKPVERLADYLAQADILVSPRIKGQNTPMKVYSYLDSGKALLATNLPTHTQVLDERVALLADPSPEMFSKGVLRLVEDDRLRERLGLAGQQLIAERHTYSIFQQNLNALYDWLAIRLAGGSRPAILPATGDPDRALNRKGGH